MSRRTLNLFYKVVDEDRKFRWALMAAGTAFGVGFAAAARIFFTAIRYLNPRARTA